VLPRALFVFAFLTMAFACTSGTPVTTPTTPKTAVPTSEPARGNPAGAGPLVIAQPSADPPPADPQLDALPGEAPVCGVRLEGSRTVIVEGRSVRLSGAQVTAGSIIRRWEMKDSGISEHLTSAGLSTAAGAAGTTVSVGSVVPVGADRYCVVDILYGQSEPGSVSLQKVAP
jgi:hypothetical protein